MSCPVCKKVEGGPHDANCPSAAAKRAQVNNGVPFNGKLEIIAIDELRPTDVVVLTLPQKKLSQAEAGLTLRA